jgi:hypothetical protein
LTTALWLDCVTLSCVADGCAIVTLPAATLAPVGSVCARAVAISSGEVSAVVASSNASGARRPGEAAVRAGRREAVVTIFGLDMSEPER